MNDAYASQCKIKKNGNRYEIILNQHTIASVTPDEAIIVHALLGKMLQAEFGELLEYLNIEVINKKEREQK